MRLTSQVIKNKEFKKGVRGYIQEEVDDFIGMIAQDYEAFTKEVETLNQKVASMEEGIKHYAKMEDALQTTLVLAQDAAVQLKEKANSESERIISEANEAVAAAQEKAEQVMNEARASAAGVQAEAEKIIAEAKAAVQTARQEAEALLEKAREESDMIVSSADESANLVIEKAKRDVLFVMDEFDATKDEYTNFRFKFRELMKLQIDTFDEMDRQFIERYKELQNMPLEASVRQGDQGSVEQGDIEEADNFEDIKGFFETDNVSPPPESEEAGGAENFEDIKNFFGKERPIEEYHRTSNS